MAENHHDESRNVLSRRICENRMSQVDQIFKRKARLAYFAMGHTSLEEKVVAGLGDDQSPHQTENIINELLKKARKRRKLFRSYSYFSWFCVFFGGFLTNLFIKEMTDRPLLTWLLQQQNQHLFSVDESIKNRIVDLLPAGSISNNSQFYDWMDQVVADIFEDSICGDGVCNFPDEYPALGRFGCAIDCGMFSERTPVRINALPAWGACPAGLNLSGFLMGEGDGSVRYTYNVFSETMGAYLLAVDSSDPDLTLDVPDGNLRLELYQHSAAAAADVRVPDQWLAAYAGVAPGTMPAEQRRFGWQYGDAAEALASTAAVGRLLHIFCEQQPGGGGCGGKAYDKVAAADALLESYGLAGRVTTLGGEGQQTVVNFPYCSFRPSSAASVDPALCAGGGTRCYNGTQLAQQFRCASSYPFSVWTYGLPRNVTVRPERSAPVRSLTPFNRIIGGVIVTQHVRAAAACPQANTPAIRVLTGRFECQAAAVADAAFGVDPAMLRSSHLYNGKLTAGDFYSPSEMQGGIGRPFAFFPHQWGNGAPKDPALVVADSDGAYKLYLDVRLRPERARALARAMRDGGFVTGRTELVEAEMVAYNADFNLFGILSVQFRWTLGGSIRWGYQYNTALLSPYEGARGRVSLALDAVVGLMLLADMLRAVRDARRTALRGSLISGYVGKLWNWVEWAHFGLLATGFVVWAGYNQCVTAMVLRAEYPVLLDLEAPARGFATDPLGEQQLLSFAGQMRQLSELKNLWTALSCTNVLLFVARFLRVLDFQPRMSLITRTLRTASIDLGHYLTLFAIILAGYATVGTILLGDRVGKFQSFKESCSSLFWILMGWEPQTMYTAMHAATSKSNAPAAGAVFQVFFWSWVLIATFLMLNIVLAIIISSFSSVKRGLRGAPTITAEAVSVSRQAAKLAANRLLGNKWLISDRELEKVLRSHERSIFRHPNYSVRMQHIRGIGRSKCIRVPGGFRVSGQDLENLLQGNRCNYRQSLLAQTRGVRAAARTVLGLTKLRKVSFTREDGLEIAEDQEYQPPLRISDILNRYGELITDGQDDEERLDLLKTENLQREIVMLASQQKVQTHLKEISDGIDSVVGHVLPTVAQQHVRGVQLRRRAAQTRQAGTQWSMSTRSFRGLVKLTVVSAKYLPKLDLFSESEPFCMVLMEDAKQSRSEPAVLATTEVVSNNNQNPVWSSEFVLPMTCGLDSEFIIAVLDRDEHGSDSLIGAARIPVKQLPVCTEVDQWYRLRNDSAPEISNKGLIRIKITLQHTTGQMAFEDGKADSDSDSDHGLLPQTEPSGEDCSAHGVWLEERLLGVGQASTTSPAKLPVLEITVVSAKNLPVRGKLRSRISVCDPYALVVFDGVRFQSAIRRNTICPEWGQCISLNLASIENKNDGVNVSILDWNRLTQHDLLGAIKITGEQLWDIFNDVSCDPKKQLELSFFLQKRERDVVSHGGHRAELMLSFSIEECKIEGEI